MKHITCSSQGGKQKLEHARAFIDRNGGSVAEGRPPTRQLKQSTLMGMFGGGGEEASEGEGEEESEGDGACLVLVLVLILALFLVLVFLVLFRHARLPLFSLSLFFPFVVFSLSLFFLVLIVVFSLSLFSLVLVVVVVFVSFAPHCVLGAAAPA